MTLDGMARIRQPVARRHHYIFCSIRLTDQRGVAHVVPCPLRKPNGEKYISGEVHPPVAQLLAGRSAAHEHIRGRRPLFSKARKQELIEPRQDETMRFESWKECGLVAAEFE